MKATDSQNEKLLEIRKIILKDNNKIKENGLENYWDKITSLMNEKKQKGKPDAGNDAKGINLNKHIEIFVSCLNTLICGNFNNIVIDEQAKHVRDLAKEANREFNAKLGKNVPKDDLIFRMLDNFVYIFKEEKGIKWELKI